MRVDESAIAWPMVHLVAGETVVAKNNPMLGQRRLHVCLQPAVVLHAFRERVAQQHDAVALLRRLAAAALDRGPAAVNLIIFLITFSKL